MSAIAPRGDANSSGGSISAKLLHLHQHHFSSDPLHPDKDSGLDIHSEFEIDTPSCGVQKSSSLISLNQPRMAQLETLEARMASIEVSLSSTPRRKKNGSLSGSVRSIPKDSTSKELESLRNALRDKENIIQTLRGQLSIPAVVRLNHNIRNCGSNNNNPLVRELTDAERKQAEDRLARLRNDTDAKRLAIKNLKMALERLDITDNIDVRIQQAELEYQLGREELNLLTLLEETRALQHCLEECNKKAHDSQTLYSCLSTNDVVSLHVAEIVYDPKSPRFGAGQNETSPGLYVEWALDDTGLQKGDRLVEVNGKIVLTKTRDDMTRLLQAAPDPASLVVLRKGANGKIPVISPHHTNNEVSALRCELEVVRDRAEEAQRSKDNMRSDNIRLTHRISYLEEQVAELLSRKPDDVRVLTQSPIITSTVKTNQNITNINISSQPIVSKQNGDNHLPLPLRSKSSLSNVSNTLISAPSPQPSDHSCHNKSHRHSKHREHRSRSGLLLSTSTHNLETKKHHHHHHHHREKDYNSETNSAMEYRSSRKWSDQTPTSQSPTDYNSSNIMDQSYRKATKIVQDLTKNNGHLYEKHKSASKCIGNSEKYNSEMLKHYNARKSTSVLDFRSEIQLGPKYGPDSRSVEELDTLTAMEPKKESSSTRRLYKKLQDARSIKSLDFDSDRNTDYASEPTKPRPTPPKKPLRLSLHRAQSLQSVETPPATPSGSPPNDNRKAMKRNYKGEAPHPGSINGSMNGLNQQGVIMNTEKVNGYTVKGDYHHTNGQSKESDVKWTSFAQSTQIQNKRDILLEMHREQRDLREHQRRDAVVRDGNFRDQTKHHWC